MQPFTKPLVPNSSGIQDFSLLLSLPVVSLKPTSITKKLLFSKSNASAAAAKSLQSCPTLCGPIDSSPPGSPIPGILQARTLEWVVISFSNAWKWKMKVKSFSRVWLLATPWTADYQALPSMGVSRQEYWSGVPLPSPSNAFILVQITILSWLDKYCSLLTGPFELSLSL